MTIDGFNNMRLAVFLSTTLLTFSSGVWANATGEQVVAGQAGFERVGSNLIITQGSQRVIINWQDFSNNYGELTKFIQPNSSAAALNRVISGNPSALLGDLEANGHIYLINPNGIVVGAGANINTQSFIASTLDVDNADFMNGGDLNFVGESQKTIENLGTINGGNGDVFLIAKHVDNSGTIKADNHVGLAGGNDVILKASGDDRLAVRVTDKDGRVDQKGLVEATKIELRTAGNNPYALAINHEGVTRATSAVNKKGRIILFAEGGTTKADGTLDASAPESGDGGFIETSGTHVEIANTIKVDTSSANGETGEWLIDPNDFRIAATGGNMTATTLEGQLRNNNVTIETATQGTAGNGDIFVDQAINETTTTNNLTLNAERNVNVNQSITIGGDINLNAGDGANGVDGIDAGVGAATNGADGDDGGVVQVNAALTSTSGDINLRGGSGGRGGNGGRGVGVNGLNSLSFATGANGGNSGQGGFVSVDADITAANSVSIVAGNGNTGGTGGTGTLFRIMGTGPEDGAANGGDGGAGGSGGTVSINAQIQANDVLIQSGNAGTGGTGGQTRTTSGATVGFTGTGGTGGTGGFVFLNTPQLTANTAQISAGSAGGGGNGGLFTIVSASESINGGDGGNGGAAGGISLSQDLILNGNGDFSFNTLAGGSGGLGAPGLGSGTAGSNGSGGTNGDMQLNQAITTPGNLIFNSGGDISGAGQLSANNLIANTVNGIGSAGAALRTEVANAALSNTGSGGIYVINTGDVTVAASSNNGDVSIETAQGRGGSPTSFGYRGPAANGGNITVGSVGALSGITTTGVGDVSLRTGGGGFGAGGGNGGALTLDAALNVSGAVTLTSGDGGLSSFLENPTVTKVGFVGGTGGALTLNAALNASGAATLTSGNGGPGGPGGGDCAELACNGGIGGSGGALTLNAALNVSGAATLTSGDGGTGGLGGIPIKLVERKHGGLGGTGGTGGALTLNAAVNASGATTLTSGDGGTGGNGGFAAVSSGTDGPGGTGGSGGALTLNVALNVPGAATLTSGDGGSGVIGGSRGISGIAGADAEINGSNIDVTANSGSITVTGAINPDAGSSVSLLAGTLTGQLLTINNPVDINLTGTGSLSLQGFGFSSANNFSTVDGDISINSGDGALDLTGTVTATNGDVNLTSGGNLSASQILTANNINLNATGSNAAIGSAVQAVQTNTTGIITANASNGSGGIFLKSPGDLNISNLNLNAGSGNAELTAEQGSLNIGTVNVTAANNVTLATTEDVSNNTAGDRNIQIGSGGINAASTAVTFNSADDVVLNGAVQIDTANSQITGERLITSTAVGSLGNSTTSLSTSVDGLNLQGTEFYLTNNKDVTIEGVTATGEFLLDNGANDITVDGQITAQGTGDTIRLAGQKFINNAGASALNAISGRWIVWSETPVNNTFGGLQSGNAAVWNTSFNSASPTLTETGNRFAFSNAQPVGVAVVRADDKNKIYGDTFNVNDFTFSAFTADSGSSYGDAFTDTGTTGSVTLTGAPVLASLGAVNTAMRTGGNGGGADYDITVDLTGVSATGFTLQGVEGLLTINQRDISVTADGINLTYGDSPQALTFNATNLASFDTNASAFTGALTRTSGAVSSSSNEVVGIYAITQGSLLANTNYNLTGFTGNNYAIAQKALTATTTGQNKIYDATTSATVTFGDDRISGDVLSLNGTASFVDKNVAVSKAINVTGIGISGTDAGNYILANTTDTTTADITARTLNASFVADDKVYDATDVATGVFGDDRIGGDVLTISGTSSFDTKDVGTNKTVTATGLSLSGTDAGNYMLASTTVNDTANITPAALIGVANDDSKVFDGIAYSGGNGVSYAGFVGGEDTSVLTGTINYSGTSQGAINPGGYAITPGGVSSSNYSITFVDGGLTINPATSGTGSGGSSGPNATFNSFLSIVNDGVANLNSEGGNYVPFNSGSLATALFNLRVEIGDDASEIPPTVFLSWAASRGFLEEEDD